MYNNLYLWQLDCTLKRFSSISLHYCGPILLDREKDNLPCNKMLKRMLWIMLREAFKRNKVEDFLLWSDWDVPHLLFSQWSWLLLQVLLPNRTTTGLRLCQLIHSFLCGSLLKHETCNNCHKYLTLRAQAECVLILMTWPQSWLIFVKWCCKWF